MMKETTILKKIINEIKEIITKAKLTPQQLRYVYKIVKKELGLYIPNIPKPLPRYLTPAEIYHFLKVAGDISPKVRLYIEFLIVTGLRVNESRHVMIDDFKSNNQLFVRKPKFNKERYVPYTNSIKNKIDLLKKNSKGYVFTTSKHKQYTKRALQKWIEKVRDKAGMPDVHTHSLRHTYACLMLSKGLSLEELKVLMGHSSIKTTEIYGRLELGQVKEKYLQFMGDM